MLSVNQGDCARCGGFLSALTDVSTDYLHHLVAGQIRWKPEDPPERLIVHKAPHLDDYIAEFVFRVAQSPEERRREFLEVALYAEDDSGARVQWPTAAVFGIGNDKPCGKYAQYLFDEHLAGGGRTSNSCTDMVVDKCFGRLPAPLQRVIGEVSAIDSVAGAHELHLNNMLKTCHMVQYTLGQHSTGRLMSGGLTATWKRALVNALVTSVVWCLEEQIDIVDPQRVRDVIGTMFAKFSEDCPYKDRPLYAKALGRLRGGLDNPQQTVLKSRVNVNGQDLPQILVAPFMAVAANETWGGDLAYFLMVHFWESEILKNLHFQEVTALLEKSFEDRQHPKVAYSHNCSMAGLVLRDQTFKGKKALRQGGARDAMYPSPLWILSCRHNNFVLQANKAMGSFVKDENFGIGLVFCENTKEATKVLFKGSYLSDGFWDALVKRIQRAEPDLWYRPQPTAPFIVNGNAAHQYRELSALTLTRLARFCREIY